MAIDIKDFSYGKATATLKQAVKYLNVHGINGCEFDYPEYGSLPKTISSRLSTDAVDFIQDNLHKVRGYKEPDDSWCEEQEEDE